MRDWQWEAKRTLKHGGIADIRNIPCRPLDLIRQELSKAHWTAGSPTGAAPMAHAENVPSRGQGEQTMGRAITSVHHGTWCCRNCTCNRARCMGSHPCGRSWALGALQESAERSTLIRKESPFILQHVSDTHYWLLNHVPYGKEKKFKAPTLIFPE